MCERLTILTSGCVGIGTATPGYRLEICGDGTGIGELAVKGTGTDIGLALNNTGTGGKAWRILSTGGGSGAGNGKLITCYTRTHYANSFGIVGNNSKVMICSSPHKSCALTI